MKRQTASRYPTRSTTSRSTSSNCNNGSAERGRSERTRSHNDRSMNNTNTMDYRVLPTNHLPRLPNQLSQHQPPSQVHHTQYSMYRGPTQPMMNGIPPMSYNPNSIYRPLPHVNTPSFPAYSMPIINESTLRKTNVRFIKLNSYDDIKTLIEPRSVGIGGPAAIFHINEFSSFLQDDSYRVFLRFCKYSSALSEQIDCLPKSFNLLINTSAFQVKNKFTFAPYDITSRVACEKNNEVQFRIHFELDDDEVSVVETSKKIIAPITCPLSATRIKYPARSKNCNHILCFDAESFISLNEITPRWRCPICKAYIKIDDLIIDGLFNKILRDAPSECTEVQIFPDGQYEFPGAKKSSSSDILLKKDHSVSSQTTKRKMDNSPKNSNSPDLENSESTKSQKVIECITIDDSDDEDDANGSDSDTIMSDDTESDTPSSPLVKGEKSAEDSDSDFEIVFERIVTKTTKSNSKVSNDNSDTSSPKPSRSPPPKKTKTAHYQSDNANGHHQSNLSTNNNSNINNNNSNNGNHAKHAPLLQPSSSVPFCSNGQLSSCMYNTSQHYGDNASTSTTTDALHLHTASSCPPPISPHVYANQTSTVHHTNIPTMSSSANSASYQIAPNNAQRPMSNYQSTGMGYNSYNRGSPLMCPTSNANINLTNKLFRLNGVTEFLNIVNSIKMSCDFDV
ncbi:E3 SUMO-protein ligase pli1 [Blomia tropicalis]|nr:E3 SUMO-protein ligase pli1 [Blomia tropicalis]